MNNDAESIPQDASTHARSAVLCFVSAKGGSGKTILAATTASILINAGQRVVTIDTDFSTRGLSLYLLDSLTNSRNLDIRPENCLADSLLGNIPFDRIAPLVLPQKKGDFNIILPNSDFRRGGAPEDALLRLGEADEPHQKSESQLQVTSDRMRGSPAGDFESKVSRTPESLVRAASERVRLHHHRYTGWLRLQQQDPRQCSPMRT